MLFPPGFSLKNVEVDAAPLKTEIPSTSAVSVSLL
jgi:hypothetical protein